ERILGGDVVEQRGLDRLLDDLVDVGLLRDRRDDVGVRRDDVLRERPSAVLDRRAGRREERILERLRRRRVDRHLLAELDHAQPAGGDLPVVAEGVRGSVLLVARHGDRGQRSAAREGHHRDVRRHRPDDPEEGRRQRDRQEGGRVRAVQQRLRPGCAQQGRPGRERVARRLTNPPGAAARPVPRRAGRPDSPETQARSMTARFRATPYLFLLPAVAQIGVFVVYPIVAVFYYSFTDYDIVRPPVWIGLSNFRKLLRDGTFWLALTHSFVYLLVTPTIIALSVCLAIVVNRKLRGIHIFRALYFVPAVSGSIAIGLAWRSLFDRNGIINGVLQTLGIIHTPDRKST